MQWIVVGEGNILVFDMSVIQIVNDLVFYCFGKWLIGIYLLCVFVIVIGVFMNIFGDKQGVMSVGVVDDVDRIVLMIIYYFVWFISLCVGCIW